MAITIRRFEPDDAEACRAIVLACVDDYTGVAAEAVAGFGEKIRRTPYREQLGGMYCLVAVIGGEVVGLGALDGDQIKRMYVSPDHRGRRIGQQIYDGLEAEARRRGVMRVSLESSMNAVGFYERMGYVGQCEHVWHLNGGAVTNLIMSKTLDPT